MSQRSFDADSCLTLKSRKLALAQTFSKREIPRGYEPPTHTLEHYMAIDERYVPGIR